MTEPSPSARDAERRRPAVRETARRETFRLARDSGAQIVTRPVFRGEKEPTVRDVEPLAGARAAHDLELSAQGLVRDYIRQAREAGHGWDQIGRALGLDASGPGRGEATPAEAAYTYAVGRRESEPPWEPRYFGWTCRSCDKCITDRGLIQGPADDELGHLQDCPRLAAAVAEWDAESERWAAEWEAGQ
jgi:hypothetical protein